LALELVEVGLQVLQEFAGEFQMGDFFAWLLGLSITEKDLKKDARQHVVTIPKRIDKKHGVAIFDDSAFEHILIFVRLLLRLWVASAGSCCGAVDDDEVAANDLACELEDWLWLDTTISTLWLSWDDADGHGVAWSLWIIFTLTVSAVSGWIPLVFNAHRDADRGSDGVVASPDDHHSRASERRIVSV
jgi:hypothetical protein